MRKVLVALVLLVAAIPALWLFVSFTATPIYPNPESVPTVVLSAPPPNSASAVAKARQIALAHLTEENLPGLSVAVGVGGEVVWAEGFGLADLKNNVPVTPDHRFRIGTASTALTSAAAGLLIENGTLKLDDEIQKYVPAFPKKEWPVTVREVMGHTAGVISDGGDEGSLFTRHCERPVEALPSFAEKSLLFKPRTGYRNSRYGWILMSAAVEAAAKQPFLTFMREHVFNPLGMRDTVADPSNVEGDDDFPLANMIRELIFDPEAKRGSKTDSAARPGRNRVTYYFPRMSADPNRGMHVMRPLDYSCYAGASVFLSTPSDLVHFGMAINGGRLLQPATVAMLQASQQLASGEKTSYGLGWQVSNVTLAGKQTRAVGHNGDTLGGMVSSLMTFPEYGIVVAVTSNISYANTSTLAEKIAGAFVAQRSSMPR